MKERFLVLDSFRGLCALSVVFFHTRLVGSFTELDFFRGSAIFVEFFFVLSGFVLAHGYGFKPEIKFAHFMRARFFRIYPLHLFMLIVFIIIEVGKLLAYNFGGFIFTNMPFTNAASIEELVPNLLLLQSWIWSANHLSFNYPSWSISIEFYLYVFLFLSVSIFKFKRVYSWFFIFLLSLLCINLDVKILTPQAFSGLFCFFGGAFTYFVYKKTLNHKPSYLLGSIMELSLLACVFFITQSKIDNRETLAPLLFLFTVLLFSFESGFFSRILKANFFQFIGKLSYSIYMTHAALLFCFISVAMVAQKLTGEKLAPMIDNVRFLTFGSGFINNIISIIILAMVVTVSIFTYKYIEVPGQLFNNKKSNR
ncbi:MULTISPECIES: acyltransferase [Shewanella]|uniref:acyltransferase family protein n=1 Tax=Shewanella TaxID=22 RepID=UPI000C6B8A0A|nr:MULTISPECIES: acyltransferase [Shewanella]NCQ44905.1 acyltransferase [Shewanella frigidimarina]NCO73504.1 acyltransferase [Shewanella vesiculosa]NCP37553.1 acyltransferase [Shewanella vesiculosa]NCP71627.1 acyltransferase [Shewanella vesiculosa]NCP74781.1 acyltransferase [Shewanella vesiculosa]